MSSSAYFLSKDTVDHFGTIVKPGVYLSMFYFFNNPRSTIFDNYIILLCLVYCVTGIAYALAIYFEPGSAQLVHILNLIHALLYILDENPCSLQAALIFLQWSVLLPVVLTLIAIQEEDGVFESVKGLCYPQWAIEAFVLANASRLDLAAPCPFLVSLQA